MHLVQPLLMEKPSTPFGVPYLRLTHQTPQIGYVRDSSNYLINSNSVVLLPYLNFTDTLNRVGPEGGISRERYQKLYQDAEPLTINVGTFSTIDFRNEVVFENTSPCGTDMAFMHQQFADNVGMVRATYWYASSYGCNLYVERQLEAYHIEE